MVKFHTIETNRLLLKGMSPDDLKYIFENLTKPEIKEILGHRSEEDYLKEEYKHKNGYSSYNRSFMLFLITDKASGQIIGRLGLHNWNKDHRRAELGYVMEDEGYRNKGLMSEAVNAIIGYGYREMNLNRIDALVGVKNVPSLKIIEKHNFIKEGVLRQHVQVTDGFEDSVLFSRLYHEYNDEKTKA